MAKNEGKSDHARAVLELGPKLSTATVLFHDAVASRLRLNATDMKCLTFINAARDPVTAGDVARYTRLTTGAVTGILDRLEGARLVARKRDAQDGRKVVLVPDAAAFKKIGLLYSGLRHSIEDLVAGYPEDELRVIADFLAKSARALDNEAARLRKPLSAPTVSRTARDGKGLP